MASYIIWPEKFLPGTTDNYVSNEIIVTGLSTSDIWPLLADPTKWETYYNNASQVTPPTPGPFFAQDDAFSFSTFGFPPLPCKVLEAVPPSPGKPARLAWLAVHDQGDEETFIEVYHAWLIEDLDRGRVRILTQESQIGKPAAELATKKPNPMLNGHQDWLDGLAGAARKAKAEKSGN